MSVSAREVWVEVGADGKVRVLYRGFAGDECFREAQRLYETLRAQGVEVAVEQVVPTQEYYQEQRQRVKGDVLR
jgi:hypothetical protein